VEESLDVDGDEAVSSPHGNGEHDGAELAAAA
jgi:hypothetical protein